MVNQEARLDRIFGALSDRTRRAMLERLGEGEATVSELAEPFEMSMPAITKHLNVLEDAGLIIRRRDGRMKRCSIDPDGARDAKAWIEQQRAFWSGSLDRLEALLEDEVAPHDG
ncbi:MAG: ArsR/SmtB family transcription factor [Minwuia sp.]|uniref:ArsR/SmtB family transcription factor n=1 Tax=Minwuia sp. TaxID=2493630 RepID=UPI003A898FA0